MHNLPDHPLIAYALRYATQKHEGQVRKYTNEPYINHPIEVAETVASVTNDIESISAALLHDVIEDCGVTYSELAECGFGHSIARLVVELSNVSKASDGNRKVRKELDLQHTAKASARAKTVKLADLLSNAKSILAHDKNFAKVYFQEMKYLLEVLKEGDPVLYARALVMTDLYFKQYN